MQGKYGVAFFFFSFFIKEDVCSCHTIVKGVCTKQIDWLIITVRYKNNNNNK